MKHLGLLGLFLSFPILANAPVSARALPDDTLEAEKLISAFSPGSIDATMQVVIGNYHIAALANRQLYTSAISIDDTGYSVFVLQYEDTSENAVPLGYGAVQLPTDWKAVLDLEKQKALVLEAKPKSLVANLGLLSDGRPYLSRIVLAGNWVSEGNLADEIRKILDASSTFTPRKSRAYCPMTW